MEITRLVKRAKRKDADAFTELMESQMQNMYKVARSILSRDEDVADAISDTILVCWEKIDTLKKNRFFRTWMTRILINKCNDILRAGQRTVFTDEPLEIEYMENEFLNLEWKEMLQSLDEKYRIVLLLYYGEGFCIKEIAQILELTESAIKSRLSRGREQVKQEYNAGGICHEKS